jgi:hypothetical protein
MYLAILVDLEVLLDQSILAVRVTFQFVLLLNSKMIQFHLDLAILVVLAVLVNPGVPHHLAILVDLEVLLYQSILVVHEAFRSVLLLNSKMIQFHLDLAILVVLVVPVVPMNPEVLHHLSILSNLVDLGDQYHPSILSILEDHLIKLAVHQLKN